MINELHSIKAKVYSPVKMNTTLNAGIAKPEAGLRERVDEVEKQVEDLQLFDEEVLKALKQQDENTQTIVNKIVEIDEKDETQDQQITDLQTENENQDVLIGDLQNQIVELEAENENLKNQIPTGQAEGENITLNDSSDMEFKELRIGGNSWQETRSGKNRLDLEKVFSAATIKNDTGFTISNVWAREMYTKSSVQEDFKPSTQYICTAKMKIKSKPTTMHANANHNILLALMDTTLNGVVATVLTSTSKNNGELNTTYNLETTFTTPVDLSNIIMITYSYYGNNDGSEIYAGSGEIELTDVMIREATVQDDKYEPYGAMPSPEFPSPIRNVGENVNELNIDEEITITTLKGIDVDLEPGTYRFSFEKTESETGTKFLISFRGSDSTEILGRIIDSSTANGVRCVLKTKATRLNIYSGVDYGTSNGKTRTITKTQIRKGETDLPYAPYNCGNFNETVCNENLFDGEIESGWISMENGELSSNANRTRFKNFNKVDGGKSYYLYSKGITSSENWWVYFYNENKQFISYISATQMTSNNNIFKTPDNCKYFKGCIAVSSETITEVMLKKGTVATEYIPHQSQQFTFPLSEGQIMYKDSYLADDGVHHKRGQVEFNGTEAFFLNTVSDFALSGTNYKTLNNGGKCLSSHYPYSTGGQFDNYTRIGNAIFIMIKDTRFTTLEEFKNYLAEQYANGTPVIIEYELAEEVIEPYTEEQQKVYDEIKKAHSYKNVTHIFSTDEIKPVVEVTYRKDLDAIGGDDYVITETDKKEIAETVEPLVRKNIQPTLNEIKAISQQAETIARGKATGYVFDTLQDLEIWLQNNQNISKLVLGDNFYIRELDVPDYWWDGSQKQQLEAEKPVLTGFVKEEELEDYATKEYIDILIGDIEKELGGI